jgi:RNA polymerase sigma factor (sigma-70 family)
MTLGVGSGSLRDFRAVYRAHYGLVWHALQRSGVDPAVIEDALQDVFVVAYRRRDEVVRASTKAWLYGIARRVASNYRRSQRRHEQRVRSLSPSERRMDHDARVAIHLLDSYLSALAEDDREIFVLSEIEGMTGPEIAAACGRNVNTVYTRVSKLRRELKDCFADVERARESRPRATAQQWAVMVPLLHAAAPATLGTTSIGVVIGAMAASLVLVVADRVLPTHDEVVEETLVAKRKSSDPPRREGPRARRDASVDRVVVDPPRSSAVRPLPATNEPVPVTVRATKSSMPAPARPPDDLAAQNDLLARAANALIEHHGSDALRIADEHARRFPRSPLADLATALRIEALCEIGKVAQARGEARLFIAAHPDAPVVHRISRSCGSPPRNLVQPDTTGT